MAELPSLEKIVEQVVEKSLTERGFPLRISSETARQFHEQVHLQYNRPGRKEGLMKGAVKMAVRAYLEKQYNYVKERDNDPLRPGHTMIVGAYYERKTEK